jgi:hypothetical protein
MFIKLLWRCPAARISDLTFTVSSPFSVHCHPVFTCWPVCCCLLSNSITAMTNNQPNQILVIINNECAYLGDNLHFDHFTNNAVY